MRYRISILALALTLLTMPAQAQEQRHFRIVDGKMVPIDAAPAAPAAVPAAPPPAPGGVLIGQEQKLMLDAAQKVVHQDFSGALPLYDQVIALNRFNTSAYLQRSMVKREIGDAAGSRNDAQMAVHLAETALQTDPKNPKLYYQRGMGYRLMKDFAKARENIQYAIQLSGGTRRDWQTDLNSIALEEKMN